MARWEPNARERLVEAAMALFEERGYDRTTVSDIVARAKLGDRTFFRYFSDKREVLFSGSEALEKLVAEAIAGVPKRAAPLDVVLASIDATSALIETRGAFARRRLAIIASHPELQERELAKATKLASIVSAALRTRGLSEGTASLFAMTGMVLFQNALERWSNDAKRRALGHHVRKARAELRALVAAAERVTRRKPASRA